MKGVVQRAGGGKVSEEGACGLHRMRQQLCALLGARVLSLLVPSEACVPPGGYTQVHTHACMCTRTHTHHTYMHHTFYKR